MLGPEVNGAKVWTDELEGDRLSRYWSIGAERAFYFLSRREGCISQCLRRIQGKHVRLVKPEDTVVRRKFRSRIGENLEFHSNDKIIVIRPTCS